MYQIGEEQTRKALQVQPRQEVIPEPDDIVLVDDEVDDEDDTYIEDGVVAPVAIENLDQDDFFA